MITGACGVSIDACVQTDGLSLEKLSVILALFGEKQCCILQPESISCFPDGSEDGGSIFSHINREDGSWALPSTLCVDEPAASTIQCDRVLWLAA